METMNFPKALRRWRKERKLTQETLGEMLGVSRYAVYNYEHEKNKISFETAQKLLGLGFPPSLIQIGIHHNKMTDFVLTEEERKFAGDRCNLIFSYLRFRSLKYEDWYDVVALGYLKAVKKWFLRKDLHKYSFSTIAFNCMRTAESNERAKEARRPKTVSLYDVIPGSDDFTFMELLCDPRDCVGIKEVQS